MQAHMTQTQVMGFDKLSPEQQEHTLQLPVMAHLHRRVWSDGLMMLSGATVFVSQVLRTVMPCALRATSHSEAMPETLMDDCLSLK